MNWKTREVIGHSHSAWYDHTFYKVAYKGEFNRARMSSALSKRTRTFLGNFGGQTHIGEIEDLGNGFIKVEWLRSIGN